MHFIIAKYPIETKLKAVNDVLEQGMPFGSVAKSLNTAKAVIQRWVALYEKFGIYGLSKNQEHILVTLKLIL